MRTLFPTLLFFVTSMLHGQAQWEQMESVPAAGRYWAAATGNSTHGYAGGGRLQFSGTNNTVADMYAYELATDTWTTIPDYPGGVREGMDAFTIGERIFFAFGSPFIQFTRTVYEYLPLTNSWVQHEDVPGIGFAYSHGFVVGDTYYIGPENGTNNVYAFNGSTNSWSTVASFPGEDRRAQCAFSANGMGYLGMGAGVFSGVYGDWWEYDPIADGWTQVADIFPVSDQSSATAVENVGYVFNVGGSGGGKQLFRYDGANDEWIQDAILPTDRIANGSLFSIGTKGFLVFGQSITSGGNFSSNALWQFTPGTTGVPDERSDELGLVGFAVDGTIALRSKEVLDDAGMVSLFNATGQLVQQQRISARTIIDLRLGNALASGVYHVQVRIPGRTSSLRVIALE